jgi:hypothetical protein
MDTTNAPLKVTINGQEEVFDPTEAASLIETGRKTKELEQKYNTNLEKVWPEYNRSQQTLKEERDARAKAEKDLEAFRTKKEGTETPVDIRKAQQAARELGIPLREDLDKEGYIKKADLDKYYEEREASKQATNQVLAEADRLEKELNIPGANFNKKAVLAYASAYGFSDLKAAHKDMYSKEYKAYEDAQIEAQRAKSLSTLGPGGEKNPKSPKVNDSNFQKILHEALTGGQE